jgi:hypothetical protein
MDDALAVLSVVRGGSRIAIDKAILEGAVDEDRELAGRRVPWRTLSRTWSGANLSPSPPTCGEPESCALRLSYLKDLIRPDRSGPTAAAQAAPAPRVRPRGRARRLSALRTSRDSRSRPHGPDRMERTLGSDHGDALAAVGVLSPSRSRRPRSLCPPVYPATRRRRPPQRGHSSTSISNTRFITAAHESPPAPQDGGGRVSGADGPGGGGPPPCPRSRRERGTTAERSRERGARTPWKRSR